MFELRLTLTLTRAIRLFFWGCWLLALTESTASARRVQVGPSADRRTIEVGPGKTYSLPSEAAIAAQDGDIVEISTGIYTGDVAVWNASNLTLRGVGGPAHLIANGESAQGKGIWVIRGNNTTVENIEFSGARVEDNNGAGIRHEGVNLVVRNCSFHDNQNGILTGNNPSSRIFIENSEFARNGHGDGFSHNIYVGNVESLTLEYSYIHHARVGHNVKSRARTNYILYNRIMDEISGNASYEIDLPNGGNSFVIGNVIQKGEHAENSSVLAYAAEGATNPVQELYVINNTFVTDQPKSTFVQVQGSPTSVRLVNNIFIGDGRVLNGIGEESHNLKSNASVLRDKNNFDYRLTNNSPPIDAGIAPEAAAGFPLKPEYQYVHPAKSQERSTIGAIDIGAYEYLPY
jgi:hypothetical protein